MQGFFMKDYIEERAIEIAKYIVKNNSTVRGTANVFKISKSTVHKDISERLKEVDLELYLKAREILINNKEERHIRGGIATRERYRKLKENLN